jgi:hypothetical protein
MPKNLENSKEIQLVDKPQLLDIVKIDGRWGQWVSNDGHVKFLNDSSIKEIDLNEYRLLKELDTTVGYIIRDGEKFTETELENIHWGQGTDSKMKLLVTVFGEYVKK